MLVCYPILNLNIPSPSWLSMRFKKMHMYILMEFRGIIMSVFCRKRSCSWVINFIVSFLAKRVEPDGHQNSLHALTYPFWLLPCSKKAIYQYTGGEGWSGKWSGSLGFQCFSLNSVLSDLSTIAVIILTPWGSTYSVT